MNTEEIMLLQTWHKSITEHLEKIGATFNSFRVRCSRTYEFRKVVGCSSGGCTLFDPPTDATYHNYGKTLKNYLDINNFILKLNQGKSAPLSVNGKPIVWAIFTDKASALPFVIAADSDYKIFHNNEAPKRFELIPCVNLNTALEFIKIILKNELK